MTFEEVSRCHCFLCKKSIDEIRGLVKEIEEVILPAGEGPERGPSAVIGSSHTRLEPDKSRWSFFRAFGPVLELVGIPGMVNYRAFLYSEGNGIFTSILEAPEDANATYIVRGTEDECRLLATLTKTNLLQNKPKGFVGRAFHTETWKKRVREFIPS